MSQLITKLILAAKLQKVSTSQMETFLRLCAHLETGFSLLRGEKRRKNGKAACFPAKQGPFSNWRRNRTFFVSGPKKIRDTFLQQYAAEKYHAATIKSYLMSLQHYCSFLLADQLSGVIFDKENVLSLREKLKRWSTSYKRENTRRRWEKMEDSADLITPTKISEFERSQASRQAIILLGHLCGAHAIQVTQEKYTLVRDYLIAQIMIDNANRAGVVVRMTVKGSCITTLKFLCKKCTPNCKV